MVEESIFAHYPRLPVGEHRDVLLSPAGEPVWEAAWQHNVIVDGLRRLLAALVKGDSQGRPIAFWAVGAGQDSWDSGTLPAPETRRTLAQLFKETGRKSIPPGQITFLGGSFTNQLEISLTFTAPADIPGGSLREFGIFAGGTAAANSGVLINHRIHPRIDMQPGFTLQRTLRLTF